MVRLRMVVLALAAGLVLVAPAAGRETVGPGIALTARAPVAVSGARFAASLRITVSVVANGTRYTRLLSTTPGGTFLVRFAAARIGRCASVTIRVRGADGKLIAAKTIEGGCMTQVP